MMIKYYFANVVHGKETFYEYVNRQFREAKNNLTAWCILHFVPVIAFLIKRMLRSDSNNNCQCQSISSHGEASTMPLTHNEYLLQAYIMFHQLILKRNSHSNRFFDFYKINSSVNNTCITQSGLPMGLKIPYHFVLHITVSE